MGSTADIIAHYGSRDERYGEASERLGDGVQVHAFADACEQQYRDGEPGAAEHAVEEGQQQALRRRYPVGLDVEYRHAEHGAVGRDEGQIHPERAVKRGHEFFQHQLDKLHERRYDQYERDRLQVLYPCGDQQFLHQPGEHGRYPHDEDDRKPHPECGVRLFGHAQEGAAPEELT